MAEEETIPDVDDIEDAISKVEAPPQDRSSILPALRPTVPRDDLDDDEDRAFQQTARGRITVFPFAMGLITLGALLLVAPRVEGFDVTLPIALLIIVASLVLTNLFRFFASGRRERGLLFIALAVLSLGAVLAIISLSGDSLDVLEWWPLVMVGGAGALLLTWLFERQHERGLLGLAILFLLAAGVALTVTLELIPPDVVDQVADYFPLLIAFIGLTLIPLALRRSAG
jgi:hypothetical protein